MSRAHLVNSIMKVLVWKLQFYTKLAVEEGAQEEEGLFFFRRGKSRPRQRLSYSCLPSTSLTLTWLSSSRPLPLAFLPTTASPTSSSPTLSSSLSSHPHKLPCHSSRFGWLHLCHLFVQGSDHPVVLLGRAWTLLLSLYCILPPTSFIITLKLFMATIVSTGSPRLNRKATSSVKLRLDMDEDSVPATKHPKVS